MIFLPTKMPYYFSFPYYLLYNKWSYIMEKCSACKATKEDNCFGKNKRKKNGLNSQCNECKNKYAKEYRIKNKEKTLEYAKEYRTKNKEKILKKNRDYKSKRRQIDPAFKMRCNVSIYIWKALKARNRNKTGSVWEALPYTSKQLCEHLEKQFDEHMSWDNYGTYWHVDHIYPQSLLPYDNYEDQNFQKCWSLENLQPMEAMMNVRKSNKIKT